MIRLRYAVLAILCAACVSGDSEAGLFRQRARARVTYKVRVRSSGACAAAPCAAASAPCARPAPYGAPPHAAPTPQAAYAPGDFLGALNAFRALHGRPPAMWDAGLAAMAAGNPGVHDGSGLQCWAGTGDMMAALRMWTSSPSHASILLTATVVGASPSRAGVTLDAR